MLAIVTRRILWPIHDALLRRPTRAELQCIEETQWLSPEEIRQLQVRKLRSLLVHAATRVPFYRQRFKSAKVDPKRAGSLDVLRSLPTLTRSEIRSALPDMVWPEAPGGLFESHTGGSTGEPLQFYLDRRRQACDQAARIRSHRWFGVDFGDREMYLWGSPIEFRHADRLKRFRDRLFNHRLLDAFNMSPDRMDAYLGFWRRYRPSCVFAYPSSLALLVEHAVRREVDLATPGLRVAFVTGERCYPHQRRAIEDRLRVPVADGYGSREGGFVAHQCPKGSMHISAEHILVEVMEGESAVPTGESGEIVITHLDSFAMPFIRYRTGDVGRLLPGRCACGRGLPRMDVVEGRATDFLRLPDGTIKHALSVIYPLRELPGLRQFRVTQNEDYSVSVQVSSEGRSDDNFDESVRAAVRRIIGPDLPLTVQQHAELPPSSSGKYRFVESRAGDRPASNTPQELEHAGRP